MGRILPSLLLRAVVMLCAALLMFAVFAPAHARPYAGDDYGLAPLPPASAAAVHSATTYNGTSGDGFQPAQAQGQAQGQAMGAPQPLTPPAGFTPAPASNQPSGYQPGPQMAAAGGPSYAPSYAPGFTPAPTSPYVPQPAPVYQAPLPAPGYGPPNYPSPPLQSPPLPANAYVARGAADEGFGADSGMRGPEMPAPATPAPAPAQAQPLRAPGDATTPYGYNRGDGEAKADVAQPGSGDYYQPGYYQSAFQPADAGARINPDYVLGTGDKIHLTVFDEADLSGDYEVDGSGFVRLPLIGQVRAAGATPPQLEAAIGSALANGYLRSPRVSIEVVTYRPFYVVGAVGAPGRYAYVNHMTVMNAIAMAGGFLPSARESAVYVRHEGSPSETRISTSQPFPILPGDVLRVETTVFWDAMNLFSPLNGVASIAVAGIR